MNYSDEAYWSERAGKTYMYKGEEFYTITPVPYYYKRRKAIIRLLAHQIIVSKAGIICDYGCGDGEYLRLLDGCLAKRSKINKIQWGGWISQKR